MYRNARCATFSTCWSTYWQKRPPRCSRNSRATMLSLIARLGRRQISRRLSRTCAHASSDVHVALARSIPRTSRSSIRWLKAGTLAQDRRADHRGDGLPGLVRGDAAFAGARLVMETLQLSQSPGLCTDNYMHIVINNQVGFRPIAAMPARPCTPVTSPRILLEGAVLHINADRPKTVVSARAWRCAITSASTRTSWWIWYCSTDGTATTRPTSPRSRSR